MATAEVSTSTQFLIHYMTRARKRLGRLPNAGPWIIGTEQRHQEGPMSRQRAEKRVVQIMFKQNTVPGHTEMVEVLANGQPAHVFR